MRIAAPTNLRQRNASLIALNMKAASFSQLNTLHAR
jgi:hypothetical protein